MSRGGERPPVLLADDDKVSAHRLAHTLRSWSYPVQVVYDGSEALRVLSHPDGPRLAILDWEMPGLDGLDVLAQLRNLPAERYVYVLMLTGRDTEDALSSCLEAGADDFLKKQSGGGMLRELQARLRVGDRFLELQDRLAEANEELRRQAYQDPLTHLPNRRTVLERLQQDISRCTREGQPLGVLMLDLDRFKQVNDTYGHGAGDAVLIEAAARMRRSLRSYDMIGRFGGEEFLAVLPNTDALGTQAAGERICAAMRDQPLLFGDQIIPFTCSIGAAQLKPEMENERDLINAADRALYRSKHSGRDRVTVDWPEPLKMAR